MSRPSHKELSRKIKLAKGAILTNEIGILNPVSTASDALNLGYDIADVKNVLGKLLDEINPGFYVGTYPPQKSYEKQIENLELFPFRWVSKFFGCELYFKFALKDEQLWVVSLHEHKVNKGGI